MKRPLSIALVLLSLLPLTSCAALQNIDFTDLTMSEEKVAAGLREALEVGSGRAIDATSARNGFFRDEIIKILLPDELKTIADGARTVGLGDQVDDLVLAMNRAAEKASGEAVDVFVDVATSLTIQDAFDILYGGETAATDLFRRRTTSELTDRFRPIVANKMQEVGVYSIYDGITSTIARLPFTQFQGIDLEEYVVDKALEGVFTKLAGEERKIRESVSARSTQLLREVFGYADRNSKSEAIRKAQATE
jgi:hypothetical protein